MRLFVRSGNHEVRVGMLAEHASKRRGHEVETLDWMDAAEEQDERRCWRQVESVARLTGVAVLRPAKKLDTVGYIHGAAWPYKRY